MEAALRPAWVILAKLAAATIAGFLIFAILVPTSGAEPPLCYSLMAFQVPCDGRVAIAVGAVTGSLVALAFLLRVRLG